MASNAAYFALMVMALPDDPAAGVLHFALRSTYSRGEL